MRHPDDGTLMALADGEIPSRELAPLTTHLDGCAECRERLANARALAGEAGHLVEALDDDTAPGRRGDAPPRPPSRLPLYRNLAWAASVLLAATLGYWSRGPAPGSPTGPAGTISQAPPAVPAPGAEAVTAEPERPAASPPAGPPAGGAAAAPPAAATGVDRARDAAPAAAENRLMADSAAADLAAKAAAADRTAERMAGSGLAARPSARQALAPATEAPALAREEVAVEAFAPIEFAAAVARLGGTLRLVEGLVPGRLEASATTVRVIYPLRAGELVLEQRRDGDSIAVTLRGPVSPDSLAVLRRRIR